MSTVTDTGTSLDWATYASEVRHCHTASCAEQATHAAVYRLVHGGCVHVPTRFACCLAHRDRILADAKKAGGLFGCHTCEPGTLIELLRMEAL